MIGKTISHYEILDKLGAGGMGVVYKARDTRLNRDVALKFLPEHLASNEESKNRFVQEARAASALDHPNICTIFDIDSTDDGSTFIVMGYYKGRTLDEIIATDELSVEEACSLIRQIAAGLARTHDRGIVHRDIKPSNILITDEGVAKVLDFGLAKLSGSADITRDGSTVGTASYMSPEQARGDEVDGRTDIWSLAVLLFEMLCGERPFKGDYEHAITYSILNEEAPEATAVRSALPQGLSDIVAKCLEKNVRDRWSSMRDLHSALGQYSADDPSTVGVGSSGSDANPARTVMVFSVAAVVILALVYATMLGLGLPDWVFPAAVVLILAGFPVMYLASSADRRRTKGKIGFAASSLLDRFLTVRKAALGGLGVFTGLTLIVAGYMFMRTAGVGPFATLVSGGTLNENPTIIVADFDNLTADSTIAPSISEALRIDLAQSKAVQIVDRNTIIQALQRMNKSSDGLLDTRTAVDVATREGTDVVVSGEVSQLGTGYVLVLRLLQTADNATLLSIRETAASPAELIPAVDRLSEQLRKQIGESIKEVRDSPALQRVTTVSLEALKHYAKALKSFETGDYEESTRLLRLAIVEDTTFAMAYRKLAASTNNLGEQDESRKAAANAFKYRDRLSPHERLLTEAYYYSAVDDEPEIVTRLYEQVLEIKPDNDVALNNLALIYSRFGEHGKAIENLNRLHTLYGMESTTATNLYASHLALGNPENANVFIDSLGAIRQGQRFFYFDAVRSYIGNDFERADSLFATVQDLAPGTQLDLGASASRAAIGQIHGRVSEALSTHSEFRERTDNASYRLRSVIGNSFFYALTLERPDKAIALLDQYLLDNPLSEIDAVARPYRGLANAYSVAGRPDRGRELIAEYKREVTTDFRWDDEPEIAAAVASMAEGKPQDALKELERSAGYGWGGPTFLLATAYSQLGRTEDAIATYNDFLTTISIGSIYDDANLLIPSLLNISELYIEIGEIDKAIENLSRFVELWQDADPELQPRVQVARDQIDRLLAQKTREN